MTDLGTLPGDVSSAAFDINEKGQVVGFSCDINFNCRAFLWEKGVMTDLNTLLAPGSSLYLTFGGGINDFGEIAGSAFDPNTGESPAFLAIPCDERHADDRDCQDAAQSAIGVERSKVVLPENGREHLRRFGMGMSRAQ
jgi:probable HAF family extracellular repeat protein